MKYAFVTPRYGLEVLGGAELGARMLAERLVESLGWSVEIFTTCALDAMTWEDHYAAGDETINGVVVHRFPTTRQRVPEFFPYSERVLSAPSAATLLEAQRFLDLQGPGSPELTEALRASDRDLFAFYPYLYSPSVDGLMAVADRAVMHPAAHDEPALHLPIFKEPMTAVQGLVFQTQGEQRLVESLFQVAHIPQTVIGLGFEEPPSELPSRSPGELTGLGDRPYLLCLGRVDGFKGTTMLAELFAAYKRRHPGPLALVLAGPISAAPPTSPDVIVTGPVDEADKWALLRGATAFVNPSPHEAFSIVLMEAWSVRLPVVVNARCAATLEHCLRSGGGLWFGSYPEFEVVIDRLVGDEAMRGTLGEHGRLYVDANYRWPIIIERYADFLTGVQARIAEPVSFA